MAKQKKRRSNAAVNLVFALLLTGVIGTGLFYAGKSLLDGRSGLIQAEDSEPEQQTTEAVTAAVTTTTEPETEPPFPPAPERSTETIALGDTDKILARNAVLLKVTPEGDEILAERDADEQIYPASMTKIMTLVTYLKLCGETAEDDVLIMDADVIAAQRAQMAYTAGFEPGEACTVTDLLYAMMLPSGADAAVMLATHAAGSEAAFAEQMNALAAEMGLEQTHFVNCTGLHEDDHLSSVNDIARILLYALKDPLAEKVMSTYRHTTAVTPQHEEGIELVSTTLSRLVGNELESLSKPLHLIGGKTGYTNPAGQCLATWAENADGEMFVSVIAGSTALKPLDAMGDTLTLYQLTCEPLDSIERITLDEADLPDYVHN
ncbi:MAG: D-alanyl-D-alanine carboxypeptidase [Oscillospiraceae bacterium]|nr:D-alanyl-D-alanine carboxypeptidase [Oscillospiraceae bacterium]